MLKLQIKKKTRCLGRRQVWAKKPRFKGSMGGHLGVGRGTFLTCLSYKKQKPAPDDMGKALEAGAGVQLPLTGVWGQDLKPGQ